MSTLSILQYNTRKSHNIIIVLLFQNKSLLNIDIIMLQEPRRNTQDQTIYYLQKNAFYLIYPKNDKA